MFAAAVMDGEEAAGDFSRCEDEGRNDHPVIRLEAHFADVTREEAEEDGGEGKGEADNVGDYDVARTVIIYVSLLIGNIFW